MLYLQKESFKRDQNIYSRMMCLILYDFIQLKSLLVSRSKKSDVPINCKSEILNLDSEPCYWVAFYKCDPAVNLKWDKQRCLNMSDLVTYKHQWYK